MTPTMTEQAVGVMHAGNTLDRCNSVLIAAGVRLTLLYFPMWKCIGSCERLPYHARTWLSGRKMRNQTADSEVLPTYRPEVSASSDRVRDMR